MASIISNRRRVVRSAQIQSNVSKASVVDIRELKRFPDLTNPLRQSFVLRKPQPNLGSITQHVGYPTPGSDNEPVQLGGRVGENVTIYPVVGDLFIDTAHLEQFYQAMPAWVSTWAPLYKTPSQNISIGSVAPVISNHSAFPTWSPVVDCCRYTVETLWKSGALPAGAADENALTMLHTPQQRNWCRPVTLNGAVNIDGAVIRYGVVPIEHCLGAPRRGPDNDCITYSTSRIVLDALTNPPGLYRDTTLKPGWLLKKFNDSISYACTTSIYARAFEAFEVTAVYNVSEKQVGLDGCGAPFVPVEPVVPGSHGATISPLVAGGSVAAVLLFASYLLKPRRVADQQLPQGRDYLRLGESPASSDSDSDS